MHSHNNRCTCKIHKGWPCPFHGGGTVRAVDMMDKPRQEYADPESGDEVRDRDAEWLVKGYDSDYGGTRPPRSRGFMLHGRVMPDRERQRGKVRVPHARILSHDETVKAAGLAERVREGQEAVRAAEAEVAKAQDELERAERALHALIDPDSLSVR